MITDAYNAMLAQASAKACHPPKPPLMFSTRICVSIIVPLHAIRGGFLTVITTEVLNGIGVLAGFKCLLV